MTPISTYDYTLDAVGNRTEMVDTSGTTTYTYDELYQLTDVEYPDSGTQAFTYDAMGNRLTQVIDGTTTLDYTYDDADQMTDVEGTAYDYDDNGNQTAAGSDTFTWDHENRLAGTDIDSVSGTYAYNGDGLRTSRTIASTTVDYVWDLNAALPVVLEDSDGSRYVYGLDLLTRINSTDEEWYLTDGLGSTTVLSDAAGDVTGTYAYDAFGAVRSQSGDATEWSYTGEQNDPSGLEYLRARYYDAVAGRFLNRDPVGGSNDYAYGANNPCRFTDSSGAVAVEGGTFVHCHAELQAHGVGRVTFNPPIKPRWGWPPLGAWDYDKVIDLQIDVFYSNDGSGETIKHVLTKNQGRLGWVPEDVTLTFGGDSLQHREGFHSRYVYGARVDVGIQFNFEDGFGTVAFLPGPYDHGAGGVGDWLGITKSSYCTGIERLQ